jgi:hypothetical protein
VDGSDVQQTVSSSCILFAKALTALVLRLLCADLASRWRRW